MVGAGTATTAGAVGAEATAAGAVGVAVAAAGLGLGFPGGGEEECLTLGLKLCPPRIFTIAGLEKEWRWRGWEEERFQK